MENKIQILREEIIEICEAIASSNSDIAFWQKNMLQNHIIKKKLMSDPVCYDICKKLESDISDYELKKYFESLYQFKIIPHVEETFDTPTEIIFQDKIFVFTQYILSCDVKEIEEYITTRGGIIKNRINLQTDYLIFGAGVKGKNGRGLFGEKYKRACELRKKRGKPLIISEGHFLKLTE